MRRALLFALAWLPALCAGSAFAAGAEQEGYTYLHISLTGLWAGFFVFLFGIAFCLVGFYLYMLWGRPNRGKDADVLAGEGGEEEDGTVF
ncbi:MAG: hypothetical protein ACE5FN_02130 [Leptospirillia bacterium]